MPNFNIGNRVIGKGSDPLIIAEIGINHGGSLTEAIKLADAAINAGAEVIKHQTHIPEDEMSEEAKHVIPGNSDKSIFEIISECALNEKDEFELMNFVKSKGVLFISTPFSREAVRRIAKMDLPAVKIGSGECNNLPLVKLIVSLGKPIILSTGMNSIETIKPAVEIIRASKLPFALLHCTNLYPTAARNIRLGSIKELELNFPDAVIGLSDHSISNFPAIGAMALGAKIIERHFTDSKERIGPDISCSMTPAELIELRAAAGIIAQAMGGNKRQIEEEKVTSNFAFASVVATRDIVENEVLTQENIWVKRPSGGGFPAAEFESLLGKKAIRRISSNTQLQAGDVSLN